MDDTDKYDNIWEPSNPEGVIAEMFDEDKQNKLRYY